MTAKSRTRVWGVVAAAAVALSLVVPPPAGALPQGWRDYPPTEGRVAAARHDAARATMEAWSMSVPEAQLETFRSALKQRLEAERFEPGAITELTLDGYPATVQKYEREVLERSFTLLVLEVYRRGELWQFTAMFRPGEELGSAQIESDLQAFAAEVLAR